MLEARSSLMEKIGYQFKNEALLERALSHSSYAMERKAFSADNERMEYLGDAVLELLVSRYLFDAHPEMREGSLTRSRAALVCEGALDRAARRIGIQEALLLGKGEEQYGGRDKPSILSDAFEAVLCAVYLDGGMGEAEKLVRRFVLIGEAQSGDLPGKDPKTTLQEFVHRDHRNREIRYELLEESGPDHKKSFTMQVFIDGRPMGTGSGLSKQSAGQEAAKAAMERLKEECD